MCSVELENFIRMVFLRTVCKEIKTRFIPLFLRPHRERRKARDASHRKRAMPCIKLAVYCELLKELRSAVGCTVCSTLAAHSFTDPLFVAVKVQPADFLVSSFDCRKEEN
jgi:hypothetical protein